MVFATFVKGFSKTCRHMLKNKGTILCFCSPVTRNLHYFMHRTNVTCSTAAKNISTISSATEKENFCSVSVNVIYVPSYWFSFFVLLVK